MMKMMTLRPGRACPRPRNHGFTVGMALILLVLLAVAAPASAWKRTATLMVRPGAPSAPKVTIEPGENGAETITVLFSCYGIYEYRHLRDMFTAITFPGCGFEGKRGDPSTPVWSKILQAAPGEQIIFEGAEYTWSAKEAHGRWFPEQEYYSDLDNLGKIVMNAATYKRQGDIFDGIRVTLSSPRRIWNNSYLTITLRPFCYFPREGRIRFLEKAKISIRRLNRPRQEPKNIEKVVKAHADYVIIAPQRFLKGLEPFRKFKQKQHPNLVVHTLEDVGASVEAIDRVIERAGSQGTRYFLLVGHSSILPAKPYNSPWEGNDKPDCRDADYVYRNHGDNEFPSYRVGRFPVTSEADLETVIAKTLRRWQSPDVYQTRPMLIAHEQEAPGKYQGCISDIVESVIPHAQTKLTPRMILPASRRLGGLESRKEQFYAAMKSGVGVMLYRGHGGTDFLASELLDFWGSAQSHWYELKAAVPPVFFSVACLNGQMTDGEGAPVPGLCANLLTSPSHGVSGTIGAIQPSPTIPNHTFAWYLMHYTYVDPQPTLGDVFHKSLMETMKYGFAHDKDADAWLWMGNLYNLYGDPELPVTHFAPRGKAR